MLFLKSGQLGIGLDGFARPWLFERLPSLVRCSKNQGGFFHGWFSGFFPFSQPQFSESCRRVSGSTRFAVCRSAIRRTDRTGVRQTRQSVWRGGHLYYRVDGLVVCRTSAPRREGSFVPVRRGSRRPDFERQGGPTPTAATRGECNAR